MFWLYGSEKGVFHRIVSARSRHWKEGMLSRWGLSDTSPRERSSFAKDYEAAVACDVAFHVVLCIPVSFRRLLVPGEKTTRATPSTYLINHIRQQTLHLIILHLLLPTNTDSGSKLAYGNATPPHPVLDRAG